MTEQERFEKEVREALNIKNNYKHIENIKVCDTPQLLINIGLIDRPMLITKGHLREANKEKDYIKHTHGITLNQIYSLPDAIANPAFVFKNVNELHKDSIVLIINDVDEDKLPILVSVKYIGGKGVYNLETIDSNQITSLYGRDGFDIYLERVTKNNKLIYYDKEKVHNLECLSKLNLLRYCSNYEPNKILQHLSSNVKDNKTAIDRVIKESVREEAHSTLKEDSAKIVKEIENSTKNLNLKEEKLNEYNTNSKKKNDGKED